MDYSRIAKEARRDVLEMIYRTQGPHIGCSFSIIDVLTVLYFKILSVDPNNPQDPERDRFVLSKGHAVPALYAILAKKGFIDKTTLESLAQDGGILEQHPTMNVKLGIEATSGSVGQGLSVAAGMALAQKYDGKKSRTFALLGDGELDEGSNWEAIMFAAHHKLDNLVAIVDRNQCQILGRTCDVLNLEPLAEKWRSFGWAVKEDNGHDFGKMEKIFGSMPFEKGKPSVFIADTTKGKGVSFMENELRWHDRHPDEKEYKAALAELS